MQNWNEIERAIDAAWEAVKDAKAPLIHTFLATSPTHMQYKLKMTEQEVLEEVTREHEEKMDRLLEGEWQAGYVAGNNDQLNGTICGRRRAANEGIARGGEQG